MQVRASRLLLTGLIDGRAGYRDLLSKLTKWRVGLRWYAIAILPAPIVTASVLLALSLPAAIFTEGVSAALVFLGLFAAATTVFEEIGWTGFALPHLRKKLSSS